LDLYLKSNNLTGTIPPEIGNLTNLQDLWLEVNQLTGSIPAELGNLTNLQDLQLSYNQLTGSIPPELGNLINLQNLLLGNNQLTGSIPAELGSLTNLQNLLLGNNQLTGSVPAELGNLTNLQYLLLSYNQLTGSVPAELGNLTNLQIFYLSSNQLTGEIPESLSALSSLDDLYIGYNALYTYDETLLIFLNSLDPDWESTQTIAPEDVTTGSVTESSVEVQWTPIAYTADTGGYMVYYSTNPEGPYTLFDTTADKSTTHMRVTGLDLDTSYYFVVQTQTYPHSQNQNTVVSDYSEEVAVTTVFDADHDGMSNDWEITYFGDTSRDGTEDYDSDGLTDLQEYQNNTYPNDTDTDDDGLDDSDEVNIYKTDPAVADTDVDGIPDGWEVQHDLDPLTNDASGDPDGDGYTNLQEYKEGGDPNDSTTPFPWELFYPAIIK
jgi:hypothetical protein